MRNRLCTSESDVYRRQIMTYEDDPRAERVESRKYFCVNHGEQKVFKIIINVFVSSFRFI